MFVAIQCCLGYTLHNVFTLFTILLFSPFQMPTVQILDWGLIDYAQAWRQQETLYRQTIDLKLANRNLPPDQQHLTPNYLVFCEHPPTYTLGTSGKYEHLLINQQQLEKQGVSFYKVDRGGDITCHVPGQVVVYPILDLHHFMTDISRFMRTCEEVIIKTLQQYNITANRLADATGVWIEPENPNKARKICAMGIRCSRWVTMHGWALNVNNSLHYFDQIVPCGIKDKKVTSMCQELNVKTIAIEEVKQHIKTNFAQLFDAQLS